MVDNHLNNPVIAPHFTGVDLEATKNTRRIFLSTAPGGPDIYQGKGLTETHKHMNTSDNKFMAAVGDVMAALSASENDDGSKAEVLFILYSLRPEVVRI